MPTQNNSYRSVRKVEGAHYIGCIYNSLSQACLESRGLYVRCKWLKIYILKLIYIIFPEGGANDFGVLLLPLGNKPLIAYC